MVRQGCVLSPLLFLILIDYVMRIALAYYQAQIREKTETARRVGLEINTPKTKVMCINTTLDAHLTIADETLHIPWKSDK